MRTHKVAGRFLPRRLAPWVLIALCVAFTGSCGSNGSGNSSVPLSPTAAPKFQLVYSFVGPPNGGSGADGVNPVADLVRDPSGNLFGTTQYGGAFADGTVFELVNYSGSYSEMVLYSFTGTGGDGASPEGGLVMDSSGNLFGTTTIGGASGFGTVFELANSSGGYTERVLYNFAGHGDGSLPSSGLVMDSSGDLYGTSGGGAFGFGAVFELADSSGTYSEKLLYSFTNAGGDGANPMAGLAMDPLGNLYGTTSTGGASGWGTVFELVNSSGSYAEKVLYSFKNTGGDGDFPQAGLAMDSSGNLFGTTSSGGVGNALDGIVFELVKSAGGYTESVLHAFPSTSDDGGNPLAGLLVDSSGDLYGTTSEGGSPSGCNCGTVFELAHSSGAYTEKVLYHFAGSDGRAPYAGLITDASGTLYGTTGGGGTGGACDGSGCGTVFLIRP